MVRRELGGRLLVVTLDIRPVDNKAADDQKRTVDVAQAFTSAADHLVICRPIREPLTRPGGGVSDVPDVSSLGSRKSVISRHTG